MQTRFVIKPPARKIKMYSMWVLLPLLLMVLVNADGYGYGIGKQYFDQVPDGYAPQRIEVQFVEGSHTRLRDNRFVSPTRDMGGVNMLLNSWDGATVRRLSYRSEAEVEEYNQRLRSQSHQPVYDFNLWYIIEFAKTPNSAEAANQLNALPEVEYAYPAPLPAPPPSGNTLSSTPDFTYQQGYRNTATEGIDALYAWTLPNGRGDNIRICDVEYSWNLSHEDLVGANIIQIGGTLIDPFESDDHGTAVMGMLSAVDNGFGVTGLVPNAQPYVVPANTAELGYAPAAALNEAANALRTGDVILIEQQAVGPNGGQYYVPLEWMSSVYQAISNISAQGIIVVEAAGNGGENLDAAIFDNAFNRAVRDSGAIIVGAGADPSSQSGDRSRLSFSCYGSRVDAQGWGMNVTTCGYGILHTGSGRNTYYTNMFNGTSSASPIVAAAAALVQGVYKHHFGSVMTPSAMRTLLVETGSPQLSGTYPVSQNIGPRPNVRAAIQTFLLLPTPTPDPTPTFPPGSVLLSQGQPVTGSSYYQNNPNYAPSKAVDGQIGGDHDRWVSDAGSRHWLVVDLGQTCDLAQARVYGDESYVLPPGDGNILYNLSAFYIRGSNTGAGDPTSWQQLARFYDPCGEPYPDYPGDGIDAHLTLSLSGAYRFVAIDIDGADAICGPNARLQELKIYGATGGIAPTSTHTPVLQPTPTPTTGTGVCTLISQNKPVTASSYYLNNPLYAPSKAVDGVIGFNDSRWVSDQATHHWLVVDLGQQYELCEVKVYSDEANIHGDVGQRWNITSYHIRASNTGTGDPTSWVALANYWDECGEPYPNYPGDGINAHNTHAVEGVYRYVAMHVDGGDGECGPHCRLQELMIYGSPASAPTSTPIPPTLPPTLTPVPTSTPTVVFCMGDADRNGFVNGDDFRSVRDNFGQSGCGLGDANGDCFVNGDDFRSVRDHFGQNCQP